MRDCGSASAWDSTVSGILDMVEAASAGVGWGERVKLAFHVAILSCNRTKACKCVNIGMREGAEACAHV